MSVDRFHKAFELLSAGVGPKPINQVINHAIQITNCKAGALVGLTDNRQHLLAGVALPTDQAGEKPTNPGLSDFYQRPVVLGKGQTEQIDGQHILAEAAACMGSFISFPLPQMSPGWYLALAVLGDEKPKAAADANLSELAPFSQTIANELELVSEIAQRKERKGRPAPRLEAVAQSVVSSPTPMLLVDENLSILALSEGLASQFGDHRGGQSLSDLLGKSKSAQQLAGYAEEQFSETYIQDSRLRLNDVVGCDYDVTSVKHRCDKGDLVSLFFLERPRNLPNLANQHPLEGSDVLTRFLEDTLIKQVQIKHRGSIGYHTLYRWRKTVKKEQISALKAAKSNPSRELVDLAATNISKGAVSLFGHSSFTKVTHVACGNSGPNCLARQVSEAVAAKLDKPFEPIFEPLSVTGTSHPKNNIHRPSAQLISKPNGHYLIVDDVATSGHHIAEATQLVRSAKGSASGIAWISN